MPSSVLLSFFSNLIDLVYNFGDNLAWSSEEDITTK